MKLTNIVKILSIGIIALFIAGCGSSFSSSEGSSSTTPPTNPSNPTPPTNPSNPTPPASVPGGTPNSPSNLSLDSKNKISDNTNYNYFKYTGVEDTKLIMHATLDRDLTRSELLTVKMTADTGFIHIYDEDLDHLPGIAYDTDMTYVLPYDGTFIIQFDYPTSGYAEVDAIIPDYALWRMPSSDNIDFTLNSIDLEVTIYNTKMNQLYIFDTLLKYK